MTLFRIVASLSALALAAWIVCKVFIASDGDVSPMWTGSLLVVALVIAAAGVSISAKPAR